MATSQTPSRGRTMQKLARPSQAYTNRRPDSSCRRIEFKFGANYYDMRNTNQNKRIVIYATPVGDFFTLRKLFFLFTFAALAVATSFQDEGATSLREHSLEVTQAQARPNATRCGEQSNLAPISAGKQVRENPEHTSGQEESYSRGEPSAAGDTQPDGQSVAKFSYDASPNTLNDTLNESLNGTLGSSNSLRRLGSLLPTSGPRNNDRRLRTDRWLNWPQAQFDDDADDGAQEEDTIGTNKAGETGKSPPLAGDDLAVPATPPPPRSSMFVILASMAGGTASANRSRHAEVTQRNGTRSSLPLLYSPPLGDQLAATGLPVVIQRPTEATFWPEPRQSLVPPGRQVDLTNDLAADYAAVDAEQEREASLAKSAPKRPVKLEQVEHNGDWQRFLERQQLKWSAHNRASSITERRSASPALTGDVKVRSELLFVESNSTTGIDGLVGKSLSGSVIASSTERPPPPTTATKPWLYYSQPFASWPSPSAASDNHSEKSADDGIAHLMTATGDTNHAPNTITLQANGKPQERSAALRLSPASSSNALTLSSDHRPPPAPKSANLHRAAYNHKYLMVPESGQRQVMAAALVPLVPINRLSHLATYWAGQTFGGAKLPAVQGASRRDDKDEGKGKSSDSTWASRAQELRKKLERPESRLAASAAASSALRVTTGRGPTPLVINSNGLIVAAKKNVTGRPYSPSSVAMLASQMDHSLSPIRAQGQSSIVVSEAGDQHKQETSTSTTLQPQTDDKAYGDMNTIAVAERPTFLKKPIIISDTYWTRNSSGSPQATPQVITNNKERRPVTHLNEPYNLNASPTTTTNDNNVDSFADANERPTSQLAQNSAQPSGELRPPPDHAPFPNNPAQPPSFLHNPPYKHHLSEVGNKSSNVEAPTGDQSNCTTGLAAGGGARQPISVANQRPSTNANRTHEQQQQHRKPANLDRISFTGSHSVANNRIRGGGHSQQAHSQLHANDATTSATPSLPQATESPMDLISSSTLSPGQISQLLLTAANSSSSVTTSTTTTRPLRIRNKLQHIIIGKILKGQFGGSNGLPLPPHWPNQQHLTAAGSNLAGATGGQSASAQGTNSATYVANAQSATGGAPPPLLSTTVANNVASLLAQKLNSLVRPPTFGLNSLFGSRVGVSGPTHQSGSGQSNSRFKQRLGLFPLGGGVSSAGGQPAFGQHGSSLVNRRSTGLGSLLFSGFIYGLSVLPALMALTGINPLSGYGADSASSGSSPVAAAAHRHGASSERPHHKRKLSSGGGLHLPGLLDSSGEPALSSYAYLVPLITSTHTAATSGAGSPASSGSEAATSDELGSGETTAPPGGSEAQQSVLRTLHVPAAPMSTSLSELQQQLLLDEPGGLLASHHYRLGHGQVAESTSSLLRPALGAFTAASNQATSIWSGEQGASESGRQVRDRGSWPPPTGSTTGGQLEQQLQQQPKSERLNLSDIRRPFERQRSRWRSPPATTTTTGSNGNSDESDLFSLGKMFANHLAAPLRQRATTSGQQREFSALDEPATLTVGAQFAPPTYVMPAPISSYASGLLTSQQQPTSANKPSDSDELPSLAATQRPSDGSSSRWLMSSGSSPLVEHHLHDEEPVKPGANLAAMVKRRTPPWVSGAPLAHVRQSSSANQVSGEQPDLGGTDVLPLMSRYEQLLRSRHKQNFHVGTKTISSHVPSVARGALDAHNLVAADPHHTDQRLAGEEDELNRRGRRTLGKGGASSKAVVESQAQLWLPNQVSSQQEPDVGSHEQGARSGKLRMSEFTLGQAPNRALAGSIPAGDGGATFQLGYTLNYLQEQPHGPSAVNGSQASPVAKSAKLVRETSSSTNQMTRVSQSLDRKASERQWRAITPTLLKSKATNLTLESGAGEQGSLQKITGRITTQASTNGTAAHHRKSSGSILDRTAPQSGGWSRQTAERESETKAGGKPRQSAARETGTGDKKSTPKRRRPRRKRKKPERGEGGGSRPGGNKGEHKPSAVFKDSETELLMAHSMALGSKVLNEPIT